MNQPHTQKTIDNLSYNIMGAAIEVHKHIGPGMLESVYQKCLAIEFSLRGIRFAEEILCPIHYKGTTFEAPFRCDFLIENTIVVELKSIAALLPIHDAQVINYMNLLKVPKGILLNFNVVNLFHQGQKTFVNRIFDSLEID
ncbi:GxxExxY protein [Algoriphagus namhaensis]